MGAVVVGPAAQRLANPPQRLSLPRRVVPDVLDDAEDDDAGEPVGSAISSSSSGVLLLEAPSSTHIPAAGVAVAAPPHQR
jgi:hypothetical protein